MVRTLLLLALAGCDLPLPGAPAPTLRLTASRPQYDADGATPDANDAETLLSQQRWVELDGCMDTERAQSVSWQARLFVGDQLGEPFALDVPNDCAVRWQAPVEGRYQVELLAQIDGQPQLGQLTVEVRDVWLVLLGDSYTSGEGVPDDIPRFVEMDDLLCDFLVGDDFSDLAGEQETWRDRRCHRSRYAWANKVARRYQGDNPDATVIVTFLACSGAEITEGLLQPYGGAENPDFLPYLRPQVEVVADLIAATSNNSRDQRDPRAAWIVERRHPDAILMTAGGNDAGFSDFIKDCTAFGCELELEVTGINTRVWEMAERLGTLGDAMTAIAPRAPTGGSGPTGVFLSEYGDPTRDEDGEFDACFDEFTTILQTNRDMQTAYEAMVKPINDALGNAADQHGWQIIDTIDEVTRRHGICADEPWVTLLEQSCAQQGDILGSYHPNGRGHQVYSEQAWAWVRPWLDAMPVAEPNVHVRLRTSDPLVPEAYDGDVVLGDRPVTLSLDPAPGVTATFTVDGVDAGEQLTLTPPADGETTAAIVIQSAFVGVDGTPIPLPERALSITLRSPPGALVGQLAVTMTPINAKPATPKPVTRNSDSWGSEWLVGTHLGAVTIDWTHPDPSATVEARLRNRANRADPGVVITPPYRIQNAAMAPGLDFGTDTLQGWTIDFTVTRGEQTGDGKLYAQVATSHEAIRSLFPYYFVEGYADPSAWIRWDHLGGGLWEQEDGNHQGFWTGGAVIDARPNLWGFVSETYYELDENLGSPPLIAPADVPLVFTGTYTVRLHACLNDYQPCDGAAESVSALLLHQTDLTVD